MIPKNPAPDLIRGGYRREIIETEAGYRRLAGFLLRRNADRIRTSIKDGARVLEFHFEH